MPDDQRPSFPCATPTCSNRVPVFKETGTIRLSADQLGSDLLAFLSALEMDTASVASFDVGIPQFVCQECEERLIEERTLHEST